MGTVARGTVGRPVTFSVDASEAGEGNLEITISARGLNIPTQVHPQGNARFAVSFVPAEACDHVVNVAFNKRPVSFDDTSHWWKLNEMHATNVLGRGLSVDCFGGRIRDGAQCNFARPGAGSPTQHVAG